MPIILRMFMLCKKNKFKQSVLQIRDTGSKFIFLIQHRIGKILFYKRFSLFT